MDEGERRRIHGARRAGILQKRLDDLDAAATLAELRFLPGRCHELAGNRRGQLALDLDHPFRLVFEPAEDPPPTREDGGLDWGRVRGVRILEIGKDYHE